MLMKLKEEGKETHKKVKPKYIKICPRCHSINIEVSHQGYLSGLTALGLPTIYRCKECGFKGYSFPEIDLNELEKRQKIKKER